MPADRGPLGLAAPAYRLLIERLADALALDDQEDPELLTTHQREGDTDQAEWMIEVLLAAGYVPREATGAPA